MKTIAEEMIKNYYMELDYINKKNQEVEFITKTLKTELLNRYKNELERINKIKQES